MKKNYYSPTNLPFSTFLSHSLRLLPLCVLLLFSVILFAQPQNNFSGLQENANTYIPLGYTTGTVPIGNNSFVRMTVLNGGIYHWDICGATYDTYMQGFPSTTPAGTTTGWQWFQDDNCGTASNSVACTTPAGPSTDWTCTANGTSYIQNNYYYAPSAWSGAVGGSATLSYKCTPNASAIIADGTAGSSTWNVFAYNSQTLGTNYSGYYNINSLNFDTRLSQTYSTAQSWDLNTAPSYASGYKGCHIAVDNFSMRFKRTGFPCGVYTIQAVSDDNLTLSRNGTSLVTAGCCYNTFTTIASNVVLGPNTTLDYTIVEGGGGAHGGLYFGTPTTIAITSASTVCSGGTIALTNNAAGGSYSVTSNGTYGSVSGTTFTAAVNNSGANQTVTVQYSVEGCNVTQNITVLQNPTALTPPTTTNTTTQTTTGSIGNGQWDIYAYNSGDATGGSGSWVNNYMGYYTVAALSFNTSTASPSWANAAAISTASNYVGCTSSPTNMSWTCLRTNVPCGTYTISADQDDRGEFYINGVNYYANNACCTAANTIGTYAISPSDVLCFRVAQGGGGAYGEILFTTVTTALSAGAINGTQTICSTSTPATLGEATAVSGGQSAAVTLGTTTYSWEYQDNCTGAWNPISGAVSNTLSFSGPIPNTRCYHRIAKDRCNNTATTAAITVTVVPTPTGGSIATTNYCASAGSASVSVTGVSNATTYTWALPTGLTGTSTTSSITVSGSTAGSYTVTVTPKDVASGITCSGTPVTGTVNVVTTPTGGSIATVNYCASAGSAAVNITGVTGATQYSWSLPAGLTGTSTTSSITVSGSTAGSYTVTATPQTVGSGITCSGTPVTGTVNVVTTPTGGSIAMVNYCSSAGSAAVNITGVTGATQYAWSLPAGLTGTSTTSGITVSGTGAGSYTVTATPQTVGSGITCTGTPVTGTVNIVTTPTGGSIATVNYCASAGSAAVNITGVTGATQYAWSLPAALTGTSTTSSITVSGTTPGSYTVTATPRTVGSGITCSGTPVTGTVNVVTTPTGGTIATVGFCASVGSGSVSVSGVTGATQYAWSLPSGLTGTSTTSSITVSGTGTGSYTVTATPQTVGSGITCAGTPVTGTVNITASPTSATLSDVIDGCNGGHTATVTITGGTSPYSFTLCGTAYTNKPSPFELDATSNTSCTLTAVTDASGCAPASITGTPVTYPARVLTTGDTYACTIATGATKIFYDNSGNLMAKITDGGSTLGSTTVVATVDGTVQKFGPTNQQSYLQRHFKISPTNTSGSANVCLYLSDAEVAALNTASAGDNHSAPSYYPTFQTNLSNVVVTKFHGAGETPVSNVSRQVIVPTNANKTHNPVVNGVTYNNVWEMCFSVTSWSGFYVHGQNTNNTPLPVTLLYLTADAIDNKYIQLDWATATEVNSKEFEIERSTDGSDFTQIGTIDGHGNSNSTVTYSFDDKTVQPGVVYYYRLKQVDIDGHFVYTEIVSSSLIGDKGFVFEDLIPNPAVNTVQLGILSTTGQKTNVTITDMLGRVVLNTPWQLSEGYNISTFDVSGLAGGTYNITVYAGTTYTTKRLVVTK